jgi:hypothetical protein
MTNLGYTAGNQYDRVRAFNEAMRLEYGAYSAFSVFVIYNPAPAPDQFVGGGAATALAPHYFLIPLRNWGDRSTFTRVFAHETGHIYWACDENHMGANQCDCGACNYFLTPRPYLLNGNCGTLLGGDCGYPHQACIMFEPDDYFSNAVCNFTMDQIGWVH